LATAGALVVVSNGVPALVLRAAAPPVLLNVAPVLQF